MRRKAIVGIAVAVLLVTLSLASFYDLNGGSLDPTDREIRLIVTGSMDAGDTDNDIPTIPIDSLVMIEHLSEDELQRLDVGDILAFNYGDMLVVHRIVSVDAENREFTTKGDANRSSETVPYEDAIGEVIGVSPLLGKAVSFIQNNLVTIIVGVLCISGIAWGIEQIVMGRSGKGKT